MSFDINNHINSLIYLDTVPIEEYNFDYPYFSESIGIITYYVIPPNFFTILDEYTNEEIENAINNNGTINLYYYSLKNSLFDKIMTIVTYDDKLEYLNYLFNRKINLNPISTISKYISTKQLKQSLIKCIRNIFRYSERIGTDKFCYIKLLVEYSICLTPSEILSIYMSEIYIRFSDYGDDGIFSKLELFDKSTYIHNIEYLIDKGADINYSSREYYLHCSIKDTLDEIRYLENILWNRRKNILNIIEGTQINIYKPNENNEHIYKYITNDVVLKEVLSYI
jgi:hypothetical protein